MGACAAEIRCAGLVFLSVLLWTCAREPSDLSCRSPRLRLCAEQGEQAIAEFTIEAQGPDPIRIFGAGRSCGCARVEVSTAPGAWVARAEQVAASDVVTLAGRSRSRVRVWVDTSRKAGSLDVTVTLRHSGASQALALQAQVAVLAPFELHPAILDYTTLCDSGQRVFPAAVRPRRAGDRQLEAISVPLGWRFDAAKAWDQDRPVWLVRVAPEGTLGPVAMEQPQEIMLTDGESCLARWPLLVPRSALQPSRPVVGLQSEPGGGLRGEVMLSPTPPGAIVAEPAVHFGEWSVSSALVTTELRPVGGHWLLEVRVGAEATERVRSGFVSGDLLVRAGSRCSSGTRVMFVGSPAPAAAPAQGTR